MKTYAIAGLAVYFALLLLAIGKKGGNSTVLDYFFGGRKLSFTLLSITFVASWWGAGSALSTADLAYERGLGAFFYYGVPVLISTALLTLMAKRIRRVGYLTQGGMVEARYSTVSARLLSLMVVLYMLFTAASQMVGIGNYFSSSLGISYETAVLAGTGIVLIYSLLGGFRAVVMTDLIQFIFLTLSAVAVFIVAMKHAGGFSGIAKVAETKGRTGYMNLFHGFQSYIMYVVTFGCSWMIQANVWQRISASRSEKDARKMTTLSFFIYIPMYLIVVFTGMASLVLFDSMPSGGVVPAIVTGYMTPLAGSLVFIGISSAIMSTMDSVINTGAMTLVLDFKKEKDEKKALRNAKRATLLITCAALVIAMRIRSILRVSWIASDIITTGAFVPIVAAFWDRRGTGQGAVASMVFGLLYCFYHLAVTLSGNRLPHLLDPGSISHVVCGIIISAALYFTVSRMSAPEYGKADCFIALANSEPEVRPADN